MSDGKPSRRPLLITAVILSLATLAAVCIGYVSRNGGRCPVCAGDGVIQLLRR